ncbi:response regulator [Lyngbya sp. PCC 8106]|uniref:hybrid sensor histidine kinase/response regulator n=1 Tax=Lyngbya sp. (strain PCC 8106) TaxID=313612 RepID=UPI0000EAB2C3|nr:response regulator [Lyngbya sp. PCC 8106]EAW33564.1 CheA Signal Transduction Histidine Kinases (STHK) [Lyngbya sp. PCC 8106]
MQAEQQQRILGYFIEEAQDHLDTIEQGLLKLQSTLEDPDLLYEVYRAAHSVKGGAAMLGLTSIQTTAHRLEDSFKILEKIQAQSRVEVEQDLESSFLAVSDTLKALIEGLSSPYGLTDELAQNQLQKIGPTFDRLNSQLEVLARQHEVVLTELILTQPTVISPTSATTTSINLETVKATASKPPENSAKELFFRSDVPDQLREMLQLFRQTENASSRKALSEICRSLARAGETFELSHWSKFFVTVERVISHPENTYSTLAPITIKAIKKAQELVLENREDEIEVSSVLKTLLPKSSTSPTNSTVVNRNSESSTTQKTSSSIDTKGENALDDQNRSSPSQTAKMADQFSETVSEDEDIDLSFLENWSASQSTMDAFKPTPKGPEIAAEELKSLADLFEGDHSIDRDWQKEYRIQSSELGSSEDRGTNPNLDYDFLDLFGSDSDEQDADSSSPQTQSAQTNISPQPPGFSSGGKPPVNIDLKTTDFDDLLNIGTTNRLGKDAQSRSTSSQPNNTTLSDLELENLSFEDLFEASQAEVFSASTPQFIQESYSAVVSDDDHSDWFEYLISGDEETENKSFHSTPQIPTTSRTISVSQPMTSSEESSMDSDNLFSDLFENLDEETDNAESQTAPVETVTASQTSGTTDFDDLELLLHQDTDDGSSEHDSNTEAELIIAEDSLFSDLDALLEAQEEMDSDDEEEDDFEEEDNEFADLERLLGGDEGPAGTGGGGLRQRGTAKSQRVFEQTAKVPVKQLDNLSNLMGELVVNRNSLEQDQERMRQFLDNLLDQVSLLSDVGQRMQDFYERSLLEISLLSGRKSSVWNTPRSNSDDQQKNRGYDSIARLYDDDFDSTELDRFTPFHTLSQEIIELVVRVRESAADIEFLVEEADQVSRQLRQVTTQLEEGLTKARMEPFAQEADRLARPVRDISIKCGKQAELYVEGRETLIDKMLLGKLHDPLIHLVNNAITHGIEPQNVRVAAGKSANGRIAIKVFHQGNQTVIAISDDGAGIDVKRVKEKAIRKGLVTPERAATMSNLDVYDLLFHPGFSMKDQADEYAGRGVGMDVVRTSLNEIRGTITTDSTLGKGTTFTIRLPLNMSISRALCCISDRARIAFPMDGVEEMIDIPREQIQTMSDGTQALEWRGSLLACRHLRELLTYKRHLGRGNVYGTNTEEDMISVIVLRSAGTHLAVVVDQVLAEQEIVIKQLEGPVPKPVGVAGATVLGDGQIVAIADVLELIDLAMGRIRKEASPWPSGISAPTEQQPQKTQPTVLIVDDSITVRSLLSITFEKSGYRVEEARDGKEAWEKLKSGLPCDLVFCDIEMPRMDGLELLSRMQKDPALIDLPIAMLTSRGADRHRQMAYQLGARGYFTKPYLEEQLLEAAGRMLRGEVVGKPTNMAASS